MRNKIESVFDKNIEALERLHATAEEAVRDHEYDEALDLNKVDYINLNEILNHTEYSDHFKQYIYKEKSGVQIPIELYEGCKYSWIVSL